MIIETNLSSTSSQSSPNSSSPNLSQKSTTRSRLKQEQGHYDSVMKLSPSRHMMRGKTLDHGKYSDTESDHSDSDLYSSGEDKPGTSRVTKATAKARQEKRFKKFAHYKGFDLPDMYRAMSDAGQVDKKYILAHSDSWRGMWGTALSILGKKQYTGPRSGNPVNGTSSTHSETINSPNPDGSLPSLVPQIAPLPDHKSLKNSPLVAPHRRGAGDHSLTPDNAVDDHIDSDDASVDSSMVSLASMDSTAPNRVKTRRAKERERRIKERELKKQQQADRDEFMRQFLNPVGRGTRNSHSKPQAKKYGATSNKTTEVTVTLRKIGQALEYCLSKEERSDLVGRGNIDLVEPTALRTRLQLFLHLTITPREVEILFKKFDPNNIGSVNMADVYGNAMGIMGKKKKSSSRASARRSRAKRSAADSVDGSSHASTRTEATRDIVVKTELDETLNPLGQLDGNIRCTVAVGAVNSRSQQHVQGGLHDDTVAEEVAEDEDIQCSTGDTRTKAQSPSSSHSSAQTKRMDFTRTVKTDIHDDDMDYVNDAFDRFDQLEDPPTPDHGMASTQSVREYNTLAESDSVNSIFLCSIDEDINEQDSILEEEENAEGGDLESSVEEEREVSSCIDTACAGGAGREQEDEERRYEEESFEESSPVK